MRSKQRSSHFSLYRPFWSQVLENKTHSIQTETSRCECVWFRFGVYCSAGQSSEPVCVSLSVLVIKGDMTRIFWQIWTNPPSTATLRLVYVCARALIVSCYAFCFVFLFFSPYYNDNLSSLSISRFRSFVFVTTVSYRDKSIRGRPCLCINWPNIQNVVRLAQ